MKSVLTIVAFIGFILGTLVAQTGEARELESFSSIAVQGSVDVILKSGDRNQALFSEETNMDAIALNVSNGTLKVSGKGQVVIEFSGYLSGFEVEANGNLTCEERIKATDLRVHLRGSGNIKLADVAASKAEVSLEGSGDISLAGRSRAVTYVLTGSGNISASGFESPIVIASLTGSGDISLHASQTLQASSTGSGNIRYTGDPQTKNVYNKGKGQIVAQ